MTGKVLVRSSTAVAATEEGEVALAKAPAPVVRAAEELLVCCPTSPGEDGRTREIIFGVWLRETAKFHPDVVREAFHSMLLDNPRNPFRPSVQDIVERCSKVHSNWSSAVCCYYQDGGGAYLFAKVPLSTVTARFRDAKLREILEGVAAAANNPEHAKGDVDCSIPERRAYWMTKQLSAIDEWPRSLLEEFGVLIGAAFARVDAEIKAEREAQERKWAEADKKRREEQAREAEEKRRCEVEERLRLAQEVLMVNGQYTVGAPLRQAWLDAGYTDEMIEAAVASVPVKRIWNAVTFRLLIGNELRVLALRARNSSGALQEQLVDEIPF